MSKEVNYEVLGEIRVIQEKTGDPKLEISNEILEDEPMHITILAMQIEEVAHRLNMPIETVLKFIKNNIEVDPMEFE